MNAADLPGPPFEVGIVYATSVEFSEPLMQVNRLMRQSGEEGYRVSRPILADSDNRHAVHHPQDK